MSKRAAAPAVIGVYGLLVLLVVYPGWLTTDSLWEWGQAAGIEPLSDWHPAFLSWAWSWLMPTTLGPGVIAVIQVGVFYGGAALIARALRSGAARCVFTVAILATPGFWVIGFVVKDAFQLALVTLATGVLLVSRQVPGARAAAWMRAGSLAIAVVATLGRPYLFAPVAVWFAFLDSPAGTARRWRRLGAVVAAVSVASVVAQAVVTVTLRPQRTYASASTQFLDLARVECTHRARMATTPSTGALPREFLANGSYGDICSGYNAYRWDGLYPIQRAEEPLPTVVMPTSQTQAAKLRARWLEEATAHAPQLALIRLKLAYRLVTYSQNPVPPASATALVRANSVTSSPDWKWDRDLSSGWPAHLARVLTFPARALDVLPSKLRASGLTIILLPCVAMLVAWRRRRPLSPALLVVAPWSWVALMAAVAPADDSRYVVVASLMGVVLSALLIDGPGDDSGSATSRHD